MPSYDQVQEQLCRLFDKRIVNCLPSTELKGLPAVLHESETIKGIASGLYKNRNGVVVATNERVFFFEKGRLWGSQLEEFRYENITSVQYSTGFIGGEITITVAGNTAKIDMVPEMLCKPFAEAVQNIISERNLLTKKPVGNPPDDDLLAKLERLAALKQAGMLTNEEFTAAKMKLLT